MKFSNLLPIFTNELSPIWSNEHLDLSDLRWRKGGGEGGIIAVITKNKLIIRLYNISN